MAAACLLFACSGDDARTVGTTEPAGADAPASGASTATETPPISSAEYPERFDAKHFTVVPGARTEFVCEVVDVDFGSADHHGYVRVIANDFGVPTDVTAVSPDAPADLAVEQTGPSETAILIGDPDSVVSGQHRYVVTYTLPDAQLADGVLALDIIGTDGVLETDRVEVVVTGLAPTRRATSDCPARRAAAYSSATAMSTAPSSARWRWAMASRWRHDLRAHHTSERSRAPVPLRR